MRFLLLDIVARLHLGPRNLGKKMSSNKNDDNQGGAKATYATGDLNMMMSRRIDSGSFFPLSTKLEPDVFIRTEYWNGEATRDL